MRRLLFVLLMLSPLVGCVSTPLDLKEPAAGTYDIIGPAEGKTGGILLFNFIPIAYNQRLQHAYDLALESQGADALIDVTVIDRWYWAAIFNGNVTTVRGTAVKFKKGAAATPPPGADDATPAAKPSDAPAAPAKTGKPRRKN